MQEKSDEYIEWETPEKPRKIDKDVPYDKEIITGTAKIGFDTKKQYFVRIPRKIAEALELKKEYHIQFKVTTPLPKPSKIEEIKLECEIIRK